MTSKVVPWILAGVRESRISAGRLKNNILVTICLFTSKEIKGYKIAYNSKKIYIQQKQ